MGKNGLTNKPEVIPTPRGTSGYASLQFDEEGSYENDVNPNVVQAENPNVSFGDGDGPNGFKNSLQLRKENAQILLDAQNKNAGNLFTIPKDESYEQEDVSLSNNQEVIQENNVEEENSNADILQKNFIANEIGFEEYVAQLQLLNS